MGISIATVFAVTVHNHGAAPIRSALISGGGASVRFEISPNISVRRHFHIVHDGTLRFSGEQNGRQLDMEVESYVTNSSGGTKVIDVFPGGRVEVRP